MGSLHAGLPNRMFHGLAESLPSLVGRRFATAKQSGALLFSHTEVTTINTSNLSFQLRWCPALAGKPEPKATDIEKSGAAKRGPFENPSPDLVIAELPYSNPTHVLVLNKFPVIPDHFILATKSYAPQGDLLEKADLTAAFACLEAWEADAEPEGSGKLFAFFNSGEHSGASQPHRHIQFIPVEHMKAVDASHRWSPLIESLPGTSFADDLDALEPLDLPFVCFAATLPAKPSEDDLHNIYLALYRRAVKTGYEASGRQPANKEQNTLPPHGPAAVSYNLAVTATRMMICPRRSEAAPIPLGLDSESRAPSAGLIKPNGTILAGTLMVKTEEEWNALRNRPTIVEAILKTSGYPFPPVLSPNI
ncbi:hypothetical protein AJ80_05206 [Polytolypa hystricis UAMH7299]|uniref:Uncharacterized protein n=1 Tax=Polytolypa hystricis (strain UAMH7299) TaxID=1447883 RepID=A0A2B7Y4F0_POLH7|nr:hypothetical protein AJ80_05206 [Polytolypa hystricis UAMH7299]